jgi:hypothetical protein
VRFVGVCGYHDTTPIASLRLCGNSALTIRWLGSCDDAILPIGPSGAITTTVEVDALPR